MDADTFVSLPPVTLQYYLASLCPLLWSISRASWHDFLQQLHVHKEKAGKGETVRSTLAIWDLSPGTGSIRWESAWANCALFC